MQKGNLPVTFSSEKRDDAELGYQSHLARNFVDFSYHKIIKLSSNIKIRIFFSIKLT